MNFPTDPLPGPIAAHGAKPGTGGPQEIPSPDGFWELDDESAVPAAQPPAPAPPAANPEMPPTPAPAEPPAPGSPRSTRAEKFALGGFAALLLAAATWMLLMLAHHVPTTDAAARAIRFPFAGKLATVAIVETFWRAPVTTGSSPDRFRQGARLLPVARITLDPASASGALRIFFRNEAGEIVGDPTTLTFLNGCFATTGTAVVDVTATDGFRDEAMYAVYRARQSAPWMLVLLEAPAAGAPARDFRPLLDIPISTDRR
jgi:hypothetical protein